MTTVFSNAASNAVRVLQQWYGADSYASSTGLYHWDDPNFVADAQGSANAALIIAYGYKNTLQDTFRWWNSANAITALIDYMLVTNDKSYLSAVEQTFANGPNAWVPNVSAIKSTAIGTAIVLGLIALASGGIVNGLVGAVIGFFGGGAVAAATTIGRNYLTNFINSTPIGLYDDEGWWALAWIKAYDLTGDQKYIDMSVTIFNDMTNGWDNTCNGGIYWQKNHQSLQGKVPYKNAIANELFFALATALYLRLKNETYLNWAMKEWNWFSTSGLINPKNNNLINDSLTTSASPVSCINDNSQAVWTYNQGVILSALADMYEITGDPSYINTANSIAKAMIQNTIVTSGTPQQSGINQNNILTEWTDLQPSQKEGIDNCQFKGIFIRNLSYLATKTHNLTYSAFIKWNALTAIGQISKNNSYQFGHRWDMPMDISDFVRQTSGVDLLNAAISVQSLATDLSGVYSLLLNDPNPHHACLEPLLLNENPDLSYLDPLLMHEDH